MIALALDAPMQIGAPDSIWGLAAIVAVQLSITAGQVAHALFQRRGQKSIRSDVQEIKDNTVNGHENNMRTDIDRLIEIGEANQRLGEANQRLGEANQTAVSELRGEVNGLTHRVDQITRPSIVRPAPRTGW